MQLCASSHILVFSGRLTELGLFFFLFSAGTMPKGFLKGHTYGQAPAPEGSPKGKMAASITPFNVEQQLYVDLLREFREINHWFPYNWFPREIAPGCEHIATIAKVMNISHNRHRRIVESHSKLSHGNRSILLHLRELGFVDLSDDNLEVRSINRVKVQGSTSTGSR